MKKLAKEKNFYFQLYLVRMLFKLILFIFVIVVGKKISEFLRKSSL